MKKTFLAGLGLSMFLASAAHAEDGPSLSLTTGIDYSQGDYGLAEDTKITVVPITARLTTGNLAFTAAIPYIRLDTPGGVVLGPDGNPLPGVPTDGGKTNGFGDLSLGAKYNFPSDLVGGVDLGIGGRIKLPTADEEKGLSTGKTDVVGSVELGYTFGRASPFVEVGYRLLGDPDGINLHNGPTLSAGSSFQLGKAVLIASYDYARAGSSIAADSHELFGGFAVPVDSRFTLTGYGTKGLSEGSADYGAGLLLTAMVF